MLTPHTPGAKCCQRLSPQETPGKIGGEGSPQGTCSLTVLMGITCQHGGGGSPRGEEWVTEQPEEGRASRGPSCLGCSGGCSSLRL